MIYFCRAEPKEFSLKNEPLLNLKMSFPFTKRKKSVIHLRFMHNWLCIKYAKQVCDIGNIFRDFLSTIKKTCQLPFPLSILHILIPKWSHKQRRIQVVNTKMFCHGNIPWNKCWRKLRFPSLCQEDSSAMGKDVENLTISIVRRSEKKVPFMLLSYPFKCEWPWDPNLSSQSISLSASSLDEMMLATF